MPAVRALPAYQQVADCVRRDILGGELAPGAQLPTERELCERFAASRITIRRALQILADEQLLERRQGVGTFVTPNPSRRIPLLNSDFSGSIAAHAPDVERELESYCWQPVASGVVAAQLQVIPTARTLFARRLDVLHNAIVAYDEVHLSEPVADRLDESDLAALRFLERWQSVQNIALGHLSQTIEAIAADRDQVKFLNIGRRTPVLKETDIVFLKSGQPCGVFVSYYRNDLFQLTSTVSLQVSNSIPSDTE